MGGCVVSEFLIGVGVGVLASCVSLWLVVVLSLSLLKVTKHDAL